MNILLSSKLILVAFLVYLTKQKNLKFLEESDRTKADKEILESFLDTLQLKELHNFIYNNNFAELKKLEDMYDYNKEYSKTL